MKPKQENTFPAKIADPKVGDFVFFDLFQRYGIIREIVPNGFYGTGRWEANVFYIPGEPMFVVKVYDPSTGNPMDCPDKRHSENDIRTCPICSRSLRKHEFRKLNEDELHVYKSEGMIQS